MTNEQKITEQKFGGKTLAAWQGFINTSLKKTDGVYSVAFNRKERLVMVDFDPAKTNHKALLAVMKSAGHEAVQIEQ